ncbi:MAG: transglutaminase family protein [Verrucomicrobiae bacterium]|nr:transglutaminase family protein [Verrucomicrobiae bacterium]
MTRFLAFLVVCILGAIAYLFADSDRAADASTVFQALINGNTAIDQGSFQRLALEEVNSHRSDLNLGALKGDPEIQEALARFSASQRDLSRAELEPLFAVLQRQFPGAQYLSATILLDPRDSGLRAGLVKWEDAGNPQYESLSTLVFREGLRQGCIAVLSRRLPPFDLDSANQDGGRYFQSCPYCGSAHAIQLDRESQTLILSCPECRRPYDVLATDTKGKVRRATDYLENFRLPVAVTPTTKSAESLMIAIWQTVLNHCDYEYDKSGLNKSEAWRFPSETWRDAKGDCEDTSLLLADTLNSAGIDARVAVGWNIHIGQHAWCVARIGDQQWILESTLRLKKGQTPKPVPVVKGAEEYQPEQLIGFGALHFRTDGKIRAGCGDYWSPEFWSTLSR